MFEIIPITPANLARVTVMYQDFLKVAQADYSWPLTAIGVDGLMQIVRGGLMQGYMVHHVQENRDIGFLFYALEDYRALEIKVIYMTEDAPVKTALNFLMERFLQDVKSIEGWDVLSYPMLGPAQLRYINFLTWFGFKPVGQAVVRFHFYDGITLEIFKKQQFPMLPPGYRLVSYHDQYDAGVVEVLFDAFHDAVDALWDPRFRTTEGIAEALAFVKTGGYGVFWPSCNSVLLNQDDQPVGVCLLNIVSREEANIPLIGLHSSERKHKLGRTLLASTVSKCIDEVLKGKLNITQISATVATGNVPAIKMYRYLGFQEDHWYPHSYQDRQPVMERKRGQWC